MDERRGDVRRETHRQESVGLDAEPREVPRVRIARDERWHRSAARFSLSDDLSAHRKESQVGRSRHRALLAHALVRGYVRKQRLELAHEVGGALSGNETSD